MPKQKDDVMRSDDAVAEQARSFDAPGTPWYAVAHGTLEDIVSIFPERRCVRPHHRGVTADDPCEVCGCRADVFDTVASSLEYLFGSACRGLVVQICYD